MRKNRGGVTLSVLSLANLAPAQALDYGFSFSNSTGGIPGTVTGRILGLVDNSTGPASSVIIDSYPSPPFVSSLPQGNNATTWAGQFFNSFTVTGGLITNYNFAAQTSLTGPNFVLLALLSSPVSGFNFALGADFNSNGGIDPVGESVNITNISSSPLNNNPVNSVPFEFNENLAVLTFLGVVGVGKAWEKWKKRRKKDSDSVAK